MPIERRKGLGERLGTGLGQALQTFGPLLQDAFDQKEKADLATKLLEAEERKESERVQTQFPTLGQPDEFLAGGGFAGAPGGLSQMGVGQQAFEPTGAIPGAMRTPMQGAEDPLEVIKRQMAELNQTLLTQRTEKGASEAAFRETPDQKKTRESGEKQQTALEDADKSRIAKSDAFQTKYDKYTAGREKVVSTLQTKGESESFINKVAGPELSLAEFAARERKRGSLNVPTEEELSPKGQIGTRQLLPSPGTTEEPTIQELRDELRDLLKEAEEAGIGQ